MSTMRRPRVSSLWIAIAVLGGAAAVGCGSTDGSRAPRVPNYAFQFARCMRASGVPNFPDPNPNGPAYLVGGGINPVSPAYQSAQNACKKYLPPSKPPPPIPESVRQQWLAQAECMRAHGVPNFPDPGPNGVQFPIDSPIPQSPAFQRAQDGPCKKYGGPGG